MPSATIARDLEHLKDQDRWSHWPFQPVKRKVGNRMPETCTLFPEPGGDILLFDCNIFKMPDDLGEPKYRYKTIEDVVADGWTVD